MKAAFEVIILPVSDPDASLRFYRDQVGFDLDVDYAPAKDFRVIQLTPPSSAASIQFGTGLTEAPVGSMRGLYLVVADIEGYRAELVGRGVAISEIRHKDTGGGWRGSFLPGSDPEHADYASFADFGDPDGNRWVLQERGYTNENPTRGIERMSEQHEYDVIVLGAGPVGQSVAARARAGGLSVAVVERELVGGECSYWGCIPSKALIRPVLAVADACHVDGAREAVNGSLDTTKVFGRRDRYVTNWDDSGQAAWVKDIGAELFRGHARLVGARRVAVEAPGVGITELTARHAVAVCTGSIAALPDIPGIEKAHAWTNRKATDSSDIPGRLAIVGGGGIAVEMATAWHGLGSKVTLLARDSGVLPRMEPFVGKLVERGLTEAGVTVRTDVSVTELRRLDAAGPLWVSLDDDSELEVDAILFAIGRTPNTADIGLESVGLEPGTWLDVDDTCLVRGVAGDWLHAMGDANHRALLTHQGKYQARMAGDAIVARAAGHQLDTAPWGAHVATADSHAVPQVFFTDPEAASVGLTAAEAERRGHHVQVVDVSIGDTVPGAYLYADGYGGQGRLVVDVDHGHLLGATFVGAGVAELLQSATVAVAGRVPIQRLWHAVPCFPTISEVWLRLLEAHRDAQPISTEKVTA